MFGAVAYPSIRDCVCPPDAAIFWSMHHAVMTHVFRLFAWEGRMRLKHLRSSITQFFLGVAWDISLEDLGAFVVLGGSSVCMNTAGFLHVQELAPFRTKVFLTDRLRMRYDFWRPCKINYSNLPHYRVRTRLEELAAFSANYLQARIRSFARSHLKRNIGIHPFNDKLSLLWQSPDPLSVSFSRL